MNRQCRRIPPSIDTSLKKGDRPSTGNMLTHSQAPLQCINEVFFFGGKGGICSQRSLMDQERRPLCKVFTFVNNIRGRV